MTPSIFLAERFDDRNLIESIINSYFIIDYGFISSVNPDKTVNVTHAKKLKTLEGESLPEMTTNNLEVLTLSCKGFALKVDYEKGDKVLLLGLKDYIKSVNNVSQATEMTSYIHYDRSTMKALPLCVFNDDAKVTVEIDSGNATISCSKFTIANSSGVAALEVTP